MVRTMAACLLLALGAVTESASAEEVSGGQVPAWGPNLERFEYPYPVKRFEFPSQRQTVSMAYMDVGPENRNGHTVLLLHGKNFCSATWEGVMQQLLEAGYRVIAPDQIGFCKSSKPDSYQYSFHQLAVNTHALLTERGVSPRVIVMGHSMGGMLAMRYALMYPAHVEALVLVNPIGLEDWKAEGVPYQPVNAWYIEERKTDFAGIRAYQQSTYYNGEWRPAYDRWVAMLAGMYAGEGRDRVAWHQALTTDMIFTQPVIYELPHIVAPTLLMIGERDNTAIGKQLAPADVAKQLGRYAELGPRAAERFPDATLVTFPEMGHAPHIQAPNRFNEALLAKLGQILAR